MQKNKFKINYTFDIVAQNDNVNSNMTNKFSAMQELKKHREDIDKIDYQIAALLGQRFRIDEKVALIKKAHNIPVRIEKRIQEVLNNAEKNEQEFKFPPRLGYFLWREIIEATCYHEEEVLGISHTEEEEE
jgi:isochorismate pyruvate lyase